MSLMCSATEYELQKTVSDFAKLSEQASREKAGLKEEVSRPQWVVSFILFWEQVALHTSCTS